MSNSNEPSKTNGQINSLVGSAKELVGSTIEAAYQAVGGSTEPSSWTTAGQKQHAEGEAEITAAKAQGYVEGVGDRLEGKKDSIVGAVTGDKAQQTSGNLQHDKGALSLVMDRLFARRPLHPFCCTPFAGNGLTF